jgi:hypothetical protein
MHDEFDRSRSTLKHHGVITHTASRLPGIVSFLLTGALFAAALILTLSQTHADGYEVGLHCGVASASSTCRDAQGGAQEG